MYLVAILSQLFAAALFFLVWLFTDWTATTKLLVALPAIALFSLVALPLSRGLWVAIDYYTDVATRDADEARYKEVAYEQRRGAGEDRSR